jgi:hypothetical protein
LNCREASFLPILVKAGAVAKNNLASRHNNVPFDGLAGPLIETDVVAIYGAQKWQQAIEHDERDESRDSATNAESTEKDSRRS